MSRAIKKVIFLRTETPYPPRSGATYRDAHLIRVLCEKMDVEVICFATEADKSIDYSVLPSGLKLTFIGKDSVPFWKKVVSTLRPKVLNGYSEAIEKALRDRAQHTDLVWISSMAMAQYIPVLRGYGCRIILDEHNIESSIMMSRALSSVKEFPTLLHAAQCTYAERSFCKLSDAVIASSNIEATRLSRLAPGAPVHVIPSSVNCTEYESVRSQAGTTLFFSGRLNDATNLEGLRWFTTEILPRLKAHMGKNIPRIVVAGSHPAPDLVHSLTHAGIEVHANPPSILPFLSEAAVVVNPLQSGGGTRHKILEAMASGRAIVSTGAGAEGLVLSPGFDIWLADHPDAFTSAILRLMENPELRAELGTHAVETVRKHYDWQCIRPIVENLIALMGSIPRPSGQSLNPGKGTLPQPHE